MAEPKELAARLRGLATGTVEWRVQHPDERSYCMSFDRNNSINPEREARDWLADHRRRHPGGLHTDYEVAEVRSFTQLERAALEAADALDAAEVTAPCPLCGYQHGHAIGCANNPVDIALAAGVGAAPAPEPDAWMWQHDETGMVGFVQHATDEELRWWERMNKPRRIVCPLYRHPPAAARVDVPADTQRLDWLHSWNGVLLETWFEGGRVVHKVSRHGHVVGTGSTLREAIDAAYGVPASDGGKQG